MSGFARPCPACGARMSAGGPCPRCGGAPRPRLQAPSPPESERTARFAYRRHYASAAYRRNRALALERAQGRCEACGVSLARDWQCDHIRPLRDGGSDELANLQALCPRCASRKTRADRARRRLKGRGA